MTPSVLLIDNRLVPLLRMSGGSGATTDQPDYEKMQPLDLFGEADVQQLCDGFLHIFQPELLSVQDSLRELTCVLNHCCCCNCAHVHAIRRVWVGGWVCVCLHYVCSAGVFCSLVF